VLTIAPCCQFPTEGCFTSTKFQDSSSFQALGDLKHIFSRLAIEASKASIHNLNHFRQGSPKS
jgi:hypothetical protein